MAGFGKKWKDEMFKNFMENSINGNNEDQSLKLKYGYVSFAKKHWRNKLLNSLQLKGSTKS